MVDFLEDGKNFSKEYGCIRTCYREIMSDEFDRLMALSPAELNEEVQSSLDKSILCGYGYYGCGLIMINTRFYIWYKRGLTCD